ncbi:MAG TPA: hypothetical protein EYP68_07905 [Candidatus Korarchaeota archaeon]|nr:hypothetical protein [Candidatus Korarchaeota archaeon]
MGKGALIAILLIAILAIGGIYAYLSLVEEERPTPTPTPTKPPKPTKTPKPSPSPTPSPYADSFSRRNFNIRHV